MLDIIKREMHKSYESRLNHRADFRVKYRFRSPEECGRKTGVPYQVICCDFSVVDEPENNSNNYEHKISLNISILSIFINTN